MRRNKQQKRSPVEALDSDLPCEIMYPILIRLPAKSLLRFKCVCKSWNALISNPQFIQSHHNLSLASTYGTKVFYLHAFEYSFWTLHSETDEETHAENLHFPAGHHLRVLCSCHGLVLLEEKDDRAFCLWNPSVRKYAKFSYPSHLTSYDSKIGCGLCFDSSTCDYKVVVIQENYYFVYSWGKDSWGEGKVFPYGVTDLSGSVFVNGILHWVVKQKLSTADRYARDLDASINGKILCFNPKEENFNIIPRPEVVNKHGVFSLSALGGRLGFCSRSKLRSTRTMEVWLRTENDYNGSSSWEELITISGAQVAISHWVAFRPICFLRESQILLSIGTGKLFLYDVTEKKYLVVDRALIAPDYLHAFPYVDSLLLPGIVDNPERKWLKSQN